MKALQEERVVYLVGLVAALLVIIWLVGMPSLVGTLALIAMLTLAWRLGVLLDPHVAARTVLKEDSHA